MAFHTSSSLSVEQIPRREFFRSKDLCVYILGIYSIIKLGVSIISFYSLQDSYYNVLFPHRL